MLAKYPTGCCQYRDGRGDFGGGLTKWENNTKDVKDDISHGVLSQCLNARVANQTTPKPADEFYDDGRGHDCYGGN